MNNAVGVYTLAFVLEQPTGPAKIRAVIDALAAAFPDLPSIREAKVTPPEDGDGEMVRILLPMALSRERQDEIRLALNASLVRNGLETAPLERPYRG